MPLLEMVDPVVAAKWNDKIGNRTRALQSTKTIASHAVAGARRKEEANYWKAARSGPPYKADEPTPMSLVYFDIEWLRHLGS